MSTDMFPDSFHEYMAEHGLPSGDEQAEKGLDPKPPLQEKITAELQERIDRAADVSSVAMAGLMFDKEPGADHLASDRELLRDGDAPQRPKGSLFPQYTDTPEVHERRQAVEARLGQLMQKLPPQQQLNLPAMRNLATQEYMLMIWGLDGEVVLIDPIRTWRDDFELFFLDKIDQTIDTIERQIAEANKPHLAVPQMDPAAAQRIARDLAAGRGPGTPSGPGRKLIV